jgi:hypothetical protein
LEYGRTLPAYCLAHDVNWKLPDALPSGRPSGIVRHDSLGAAQSRLATDPRGVHSISCSDAEPVISLAIRIAAESLKQNEGRCGIPAFILIDEIVSAAGASPYRFGEQMKEMLATRRHKNIGLMWTAQSPRLVNNQMMGLATEIICFRLNHKRDLDSLEEVGFTVEELDVIRALPDHHYIIHELK